MHLSHMRPFVADHGLSYLTRSSAQQAYATQRVPPLPSSSDGQDSRGARQPTPQRAVPKMFGTDTSAIKSFSSQLAALDLSRLGSDDAVAAASSEPATPGASDETSLFQLLAMVSGPSAESSSDSR